jgi:hypothetical protein
MRGIDGPVATADTNGTCTRVGGKPDQLVVDLRTFAGLLDVDCEISGMQPYLRGAADEIERLAGEVQTLKADNARMLDCHGHVWGPPVKRGGKSVCVCEHCGVFCPQQGEGS